MKFVSRILDLQFHSGTRIHSLARKVSPGSYTTDIVPRACNRIYKNDNDSDWGKKTVHLHALTEYPFKLPSNNQETSANHRSDSVLI